jgi:hypothetical protein
LEDFTALASSQIDYLPAVRGGWLRLTRRTAQLWAVPIAATLCMNSLGIVRWNLGESCV